MKNHLSNDIGKSKKSRHQVKYTNTLFCIRIATNNIMEDICNTHVQQRTGIQNIYRTPINQ